MSGGDQAWLLDFAVRANAARRFWPKVRKSKKPDGCWIWRGSQQVKGYGNFRIGRRVFTAHRVALALVTGQQGIGLDACHRPGCSRLCVRATNGKDSHLTWKTHYENCQEIYGRKVATQGVFGERRADDNAREA